MSQDGSNKRGLNNLRHGAFAKAAILPGEDPAEFEMLCQDVFDELQPQGVLEEDAALTIEKLVWRKGRLFAFRQKSLLSLASEVAEPGMFEVLLALRASKSKSPDRSALDQPPEVDLATFEKELNIEEWLDMLIDRAVKRLAQLKTMKGMFAFTASKNTVGFTAPAGRR